MLVIVYLYSRIGLQRLRKKPLQGRKDVPQKLQSVRENFISEGHGFTACAKDLFCIRARL
jgi:hypothetical protein